LEDVEKSIDHDQQAIQLAPKFAPAYAALGDAYAVISYRGGPCELIAFHPDSLFWWNQARRHSHSISQLVTLCLTARDL
jgi:hypothetical protein